VGESLRAALGEIAEVAPDWLLGVVSPDWFDRYVHRFELQRFPKGEQAKALLRRQVGEDSWHRLASRAGRARSPAGARLPQSGTLATGMEPTFRAY
jgi:transposase